MARTGLKFIDLFAGLGGFHAALSSLNHRCVFASEIDDELRKIYKQNFPELSDKRLVGDIRGSKDSVPPHNILCAGFPCQPFSKSGTQSGIRDRTRGTLFHDILELVGKHHPEFVLLENVGNFERHDGGRTWEVVRCALADLDYNVIGTEHVATGGHGLVSPHHLGYPHTRERFFIVATKQKLKWDPFPQRDSPTSTSLASIAQSNHKLSDVERVETRLPDHYRECIDHWNSLLANIPHSEDLPSFPIWGDEFGARYPFENGTPSSYTIAELGALLGVDASGIKRKSVLLDRLPSYARATESHFPTWKTSFIRQNRDWYRSIRPFVPKDWLGKLRAFPPSLRKLEWNCKGEARDLWMHVLQFRPSGLRAKRYTSSPALVAMTTSQIPVLGPQRRFITRTEGLRLQGFGDNHLLPASHQAAFTALGNAVHVGVVRAIAESVIRQL